MKKGYLVYFHDLVTDKIGNPLSVHTYLKDARVMVKRCKSDDRDLGLIPNGEYLIILKK
jgi:hypothetical protein